MGEYGMTDIETLLATEALRRLKAAYFRSIDSKNWDELAMVFTEDATFDIRGALEMPKPEAAYANEPVITGRANIVAFIEKGVAALASVHHGHMPEIEIFSASSARAVWAMEDILVPHSGSPFKVFRGYGYYTDDCVNDGGVWRISALKLRRFYVEMS
jgi:hypothetical protein